MEDNLTKSNSADNYSVSYNALKNSTYTFIAYVFPIVFSIFITPVVVHRLGVTDYGVYVLINTILGFLGLLDLGLGVALIKFAAEYHAKKDFISLQKLIQSANALFLAIGVLSLAVFVVVGAFFLPLFNVGSQSVQHIFLVFILAGVLGLITSINWTFVILPGAMQRFDISSTAGLFQLAGFNLLMLAAVILGYRLKVILSLNILTVLLMGWYLRKRALSLLPEIKFGLGWDKEQVVKAYRFGLFASIANVAGNFLAQFDRLVVPIYLNPAQLSYYSLPGNVAQKINGITGSLPSVLFPLTSGMAGTGDFDRIRIIYRRYIRNIALIAAAGTAALIVFARKILLVWLGPEFAEKGTKILIILAVTYFLLALFNSLTTFLLGLGKTKFLAVMSGMFAAVNIILLFIFLPRAGIEGAAWAYLGAACLTPAAFIWAESRYLGIYDQTAFYAKLFLKLAFTGCIFYMVMHYFVDPYLKNFVSVIIVGPLSVLSFFGLYRLFGFIEAEDWQLFTGYGKKIAARFGLGRFLKG